MSNLPSISRVKQWADARLSNAGCHRDEMDVAVFVAIVLAGASIDAERLAAIQRSFAPIDDDGLLRMEVKRCDVDELLDEVLRLRAANVVAEGERTTEYIPAGFVEAPGVDAAIFHDPTTATITTNPETLER